VNNQIWEKYNIFRNRFVLSTLPFLDEFGWDQEYGGLVESISREGRAGNEDFRRVMVHARQLFVFSKWGHKTFNSDFVKKADKIFEYMKQFFWDEQYAGWRTDVNLDGGSNESSKNLYAHAFVLFGLVQYRITLDRVEAEKWIDETVKIIEEKFQRTDGSYREEMTREFEDKLGHQRNQNPHMHLLEASLLLYEQTQDRRTFKLAKRLLKLFETRFLHPGELVIREYLDKKFQPNASIGHKIEPGHHYEWAWLLNWAATIFEEDKYRIDGGRLLKKALEFGWDSSFGGVYDQVDCRNFEVLLTSKRLWPLLELIKALMVFPNEGNLLKGCSAIDILLDKYLHEGGVWTERLSQDWKTMEGFMPVSSGYHLGMALIAVEEFVESNIGE
tara:strand:- start:1653 stop:2813 length:1161 start_codon:yes stop_codon:yes gene_type:complete